MRRDESITKDGATCVAGVMIQAEVLFGGEPILLRHDRACKVLMVFYAPLFDWSVLGVWQVGHGWLLADKEKPELVSDVAAWLREEMPCTCNPGQFQGIRDIGAALGRSPEESEAKIAKLRAQCLGCAG